MEKGARLEVGTTDALNDLGGKSSTHSRRHILKRGVVSKWSFYLSLFSTLASVQMFVRTNYAHVPVYGDAKHLARSKKAFEDRSKKRFSDHLVRGKRQVHKNHTTCPPKVVLQGLGYIYMYSTIHTSCYTTMHTWY